MILISIPNFQKSGNINFIHLKKKITNLSNKWWATGDKNPNFKKIPWIETPFLNVS